MPKSTCPPHSALRLPLQPLLLGAWLGAVYGCGAPPPPDESTVRGAMAALADALERDAVREVFRRLDQRARHAMHAIAEAGRERAAIVRAGFPEPERGRELARIGKTDAPDGVALFARRCPTDCRDALRARLGAVVERREEHGLVRVRTATGHWLQWRKGSDGRFGLVWHTEELERERARAFQALRDTRRAAAHHRERRMLAR